MRVMREGRNKRSDANRGKLRPFLWGGGVLLLGILVMNWWGGGNGIEETEVIPKGGAGRMVVSDDSSKGGGPALKEGIPGRIDLDTQNPKGPVPPSGEILKSEGKLNPVPESPHEEEFTFYKTLAKEQTVGIKEIKGNAPVKKATPKGIPSPQSAVHPIAPPEDQKLFTIQVAAFREKDRAEGMVENLKQKGYPAYLHVKEGIRGPDWFRVRVGKYPDQIEAHQEAETIRGKEGLPPFVTLTSN